MQQFERETRRLTERLVAELLGLAEALARAEIAEARHTLGAQEKRRAARERLAERAEREERRAQRKAERERLREELKMARQRERDDARQEREERHAARRRPSEADRMAMNMLRPAPLFVHKRKTDGSIQELVRGDGPSPAPPAG